MSELLEKYLEKYPKLKKARDFSIKQHQDTNHTYDGKPYYVHLDMVFEYVYLYSHLIDEDILIDIMCGAYTHDLIEDARTSYHTVKKTLSEYIADITFALTCGKGKTRKEKFSDSYFLGILRVKGASFLKICDRLANSKYSYIHENKSKLKMYSKEYDRFKSMLDIDGKYSVMFEELESFYI